MTRKQRKELKDYLTKYGLEDFRFGVNYYARYNNLAKTVETFIVWRNDIKLSAQIRPLLTVRAIKRGAKIGHMWFYEKPGSGPVYFASYQLFLEYWRTLQLTIKLAGL